MYLIDDELEETAREIIETEERFASIRACRICFLRCDESKKKDGKTVYADTVKLNDKLRAIGGYDFAVTFYADAAAERISAKARGILMRHELMHIGFDRGVPKILPHDVSDFKELIDRYGFDWIKTV